MKDHNSYECDENETCGLEMKGGLASNIDYPANYYHAPKSCYPEKNSIGGERCDPSIIMGQVLRGK